MNKTELETIALQCLERIETESRTARQSQDEKIRRLESKVTDFELQLMRLSGLFRRLEPLAENLNSILNGGRR